VKVDFKRTLDGYQARRGEFRVLDLPATRYLAIDGYGDPNTSPAYAEAVATLYPVAYALKFASRAALGHDYVVPPLEALWWADDPASFTSRRDKSQWRWTVLLMVPDHLPADLVEEAIAAVAAKGTAPAIDRLRVLTLDEGRCVQTLHVGSYDDEGPLLAEMHERVIPGHGLRMTGHHHEIYLNDPRRTAPERLRTILRQPVVPRHEPRHEPGPGSVVSLP
jgi:hypothetical protein